MTVEECYTALEGDYANVMNRLGSEDLIKRFAGRFLDQTCFQELCDALDAGDTKAAFSAAHTLKGVCLNLDFTKLATSASEITELLRGENLQEAKTLLARVTKDYNQTVDAIKQL